MLLLVVPGTSYHGRRVYVHVRRNVYIPGIAVLYRVSSVRLFLLAFDD